MYITPLSKVKTNTRSRIIRFFNPYEDRVNTGEDTGPSLGHFDRFPNFARTFYKILEYYPDTFEDL